MVRAPPLAVNGRPALSRCSARKEETRAGDMMFDGVISSQMTARPLGLSGLTISGRGTSLRGSRRMQGAGRFPSPSHRRMFGASLSA